MDQPTPTVASSPGATAPGAGPILLGTEFGSVSSAAERFAIRLAAERNVPLLIVHGIDPGRLRLPGGIFVERVDQVRAARQADALTMMERVRTAGVVPQVLIWDGDPATCIVEAARSEGASRIVVGSHGRGRIGRAIIGSVSASVIAQASCPVDVVRAGDASDDVITVSSVAHPS